MKNILKLFLSLLFIGLVSCDEEGLEMLQAELTNPPVLHEVGQANLNAETPSNQALQLIWDDADYGVNTQVDYEVQVSSTESFDEFTTITETTGRVYAWNVATLNVLALNSGLNANEEGSLYFRIKSSIGEPAVQEAFSNVIQVTMEPFASYTFKDYYLVGSGTSAGWNPDNNNMPMFRSANNENFYSFTGYFFNSNPSDLGEGRFKLLEQLGEWQPQWGTNYQEPDDLIETAGQMAGNPSTQSSDPGRFGVTESGFYTFTINMAELSYTVEPYDANAAAEYPTIGLIGDATPGGWDTDTDMTVSDFDAHKWFIQDIELGNGFVKFRANDDWAENWGSGTAYSGTGTMGGDNIPVSSGVYDIWFNDLTGEYMLIPQAQD